MSSNPETTVGRIDLGPTEPHHEVTRLKAEVERLRSWLREIGRNPVAPTPAAIERIIANV